MRASQAGLSKQDLSVPKAGYERGWLWGWSLENVAPPAHSWTQLEPQPEQAEALLALLSSKEAFTHPLKRLSRIV